MKVSSLVKAHISNLLFYTSAFYVCSDLVMNFNSSGIEFSPTILPYMLFHGERCHRILGCVFPDSWHGWSCICHSGHRPYPPLGLWQLAFCYFCSCCCLESYCTCHGVTLSNSQMSNATCIKSCPIWLTWKIIFCRFAWKEIELQSRNAKLVSIQLVKSLKVDNNGSTDRLC